MTRRMAPDAIRGRWAVPAGRAGASRPTIGRSRDRSAASLGIRAGPGGLADVQLSVSLRHSAEMGENRVRDGETTRERPDTTRRHPRVRLWTRQELITTLDRWRAR